MKYLYLIFKKTLFVFTGTFFTAGANYNNPLTDSSFNYKD